MGQMPIKGRVLDVSTAILRVYRSKRGFLHRIERFWPRFQFFFPEFRNVALNLLKSAMIYPTVAILVHFH